MKKLFSLIAAVLFAGSMMAVDFTLSNAGTVTKDGVTVVFDKGAGQSAPAWYDKGLRLYASNTVTISSESTITAISFNWEKQGTKAFNTVTASTGNYTHPSEAGVGSWTGEANSVVFTLGATGQLQLNTFSVTLGEGGGGETPAVATPVISGNAEFTESTQVTITCATEGAAIYYTLNGADPTTNSLPYDEPFTLTESATVKAVAYDSQADQYSAVATKTFTKKDPQQEISCLEVYQMAKNDVVGLLNPVTVTYSNAANVWVMDGSASMLIYLPSGFTNNFKAGDILSGIAGTVDIYQNIVYEIKPDATQAAAIMATPGEAPAPSQAAVIEASDVNKYVILPGFSIKGEFTAEAKTSLPAVLGEDTVTIYNNFKFAYTFVAGKTYNITGVVSAYKGDPQVYFISAEEAGGEIVPPTPVTDPTNCAEAAQAALSVSENNELYNNGASYTITGYVTSIAYAWKEGSMSFWMADTENGGNVLEAYKCAIANETDAVLVGDKVAVTGQLTKFNSTPEFAAGCTVEIIERAEAAKNLGEKTIAEFLELKNAKDTCILTGVVSNIQNEEYGNFDLVDETGSVYIYGLLTPEGEAKKFAELGVEAGDTLTVLAIYSEFKGTPQVKNAIFVELVKGEGGGSGGEYSYDYEPDEVLTFNVEMATAEIEDYTADYGVVTMYFESADGSYFASMELIISSADLVVPGAYQISDSEEEGTFYASPGGDDEYDYGCFFGVTYIDPEDGNEYYYPYYLVSGNVTIAQDGIQVQAKSYYGSTVNFSYVEKDDAVVNTKLTDKLLKAIENGNVIIKSGNVIFNVNGQRVK